MIIKSKHHFVIYPFFKWYSRRITKKSFHKVVVNGEFNDRNLPVLVICNHFSWWDGFWVMMLNETHIRRKFHFMMLEEQLLRHRFLNYTGGFSVSKNSKSVLESLNYCNELLMHPGNMVLIFPQGKIESQHQHQFSFGKGIERIIGSKRDGALQVLFVSNLVDYFSNRKPTLTINLKEMEGVGLTLAEIETAYNNFHAACIARQLNSVDQ